MQEITLTVRFDKFTVHPVPGVDKYDVVFYDAEGKKVFERRVDGVEWELNFKPQLEKLMKDAATEGGG